MAYNNYFPTYTPIAPGFYGVPNTPAPTVPTATPAQQAPQNNGPIVWVQGEAGAKSYLVAPNTTVLLMDSEGDRFFLKSADASGVPLPLRTFKYEEIKAGAVPATGEEYALKKDLDEIRKQLAALKEAKTDE